MSRLRAILYVLVVLFVVSGSALATQPKRAALTRERPHGAFFAWQTRWTKIQADALQQSTWKKVYLRFFDIKFDSQRGEPRPEAPIGFLAPFPKSTEMVAVVFVENRVFLGAQPAQLESLPRNVLGKLRSLLPSDASLFVEILIDCDWTPSTREAYFAFLRALKSQSSGIRVSSTIRLHQVKYSAKTGVPPVERGMLMFYNMGRLEAEPAGEAAGEGHSIFSFDDASRYTASIPKYSLPLDLALPAFSWGVHSRNDRIIRLIEGVDESDFSSREQFRSVHRSTFRAETSLLFRGRYFEAGDLVRVEAMTTQTTLAAAQLAAKFQPPSTPYDTVAIFDLNERMLKAYDNTFFATLLDAFARNTRSTDSARPTLP